MKRINTTQDPHIPGAIRAENFIPGDRVSTDQFECRLKGGLPYSKGKEDPEKMFSGGTIFVDHAYQFIDLH